LDVATDIAVVIPAYNEAENLPPVIDELLAELARLPAVSDVVVVDDGSTDDTAVVLDELEKQHANVRTVRFRRNAGKSAAVDAGLEAVNSRTVILMDADGQDDPAAIPAMLDALDGGLDLVTGRRQVRRDRFVKRTTSRLYNAVTSKITGIPGRDFNSGFKAMRRDVADSLDLYGELHRYIPVLAHWQGFRVGEVDVNHRPRLAGTSKFGGNRFLRGFLDLVAVKFLTTYTTRPLHLFGGLGILFGIVGGGILAYLLIDQILGNPIGGRPALIAGVLFVIVGVQMVSLGLLAALFVHLARSGRDRSPRETR